MFLSPANANPGSLLIGLFCTDRVLKLWRPYTQKSRHFNITLFWIVSFKTDLECEGFDDRYVVWVQYQVFQVLEVGERWKRWSMSAIGNTGGCFFLTVCRDGFQVLVCDLDLLCLGRKRPGYLLKAARVTENLSEKWVMFLWMTWYVCV